MKNILFVDVEAVYTSLDTKSNPSVYIQGSERNIDSAGIFTEQETEFGNIKLYTDGSWNIQHSDILEDSVGLNFIINTSSTIPLSSDTNSTSLDTLIIKSPDSYSNMPEDNSDMFLLQSGLS